MSAIPVSFDEKKGSEKDGWFYNLRLGSVTVGGCREAHDDGERTKKYLILIQTEHSGDTLLTKPYIHRHEHYWTKN